jgi:hypothetical protein
VFDAHFTILSSRFIYLASLGCKPVSEGERLDSDCARANNRGAFMLAKLTMSFAAFVGLVAVACASDVEAPNSVAASESAKTFGIPAISDDAAQEVVAHAEAIKQANPQANLLVVQGEDGVTIQGDAASLRQLLESFETSEGPQQKSKPRWCFQYGIAKTGAWVSDGQGGMTLDMCLGEPLGPLCHSGLYWTQLGANIDAVAWAARNGCSATISVKSGSCPASHAPLSCW